MNSDSGQEKERQPQFEERAKILIVDDEKIYIDVLVGLLAGEYKVIVAKSGMEALKRLESDLPPDLILLDIMMPEMDGYEVCRKIKKDPKVRDIPVIFITGKNEEQDEAGGFQAGAVDYITKPFSPLIALARVRTHIELKRRGDMLEWLAGLDGLTGIPNRRQFDRVLDAEWKRSVRHGHCLSLLLMDIDHFKLFNDHYGHAEGDECLKRVAGAIKRAMPRSEDIAARYGGEEFGCILPETRLEGARAVADRVMESVRDLNIPHAKSKVTEHVTISIGVATMTPKIIDMPTNLVEKADAALYHAKGEGRNQVACMPA